MKLLKNLYIRSKKIQIDFLARSVFTLINFFKYRQDLKKCLLYHQFYDPKALNIDFSINKLISLNLDVIKKTKIKTLILDYDGVLGFYKAMEPLPEVLSWLEQAITVFGPGNLFILSNNPAVERKLFLDKYFNGKIEFVISKPKPYPDGIAYVKACVASLKLADNNALKSNDNNTVKYQDDKVLEPENSNLPQDSDNNDPRIEDTILLVDDRLATGILAAKISGIASCLILEPYISIKKNFLVESLLVIIRKLEKLIIWHS